MIAYLCLNCYYVFAKEGPCPQCKHTQSEEIDVEKEDLQDGD